MATYTSSVYNNNQPKYVYAGDQSVSGQINMGATASSNGDILFLAKLPQGAVVVEIIESHTTGATTQALSFGLGSGGAAGGGASYSAFIASGAQATQNRLSVQGPPITVSVSDNDTQRWAALTAKVESGTATTSLIVNFTVLYRVDGPMPV